jgi:hypothetical protein
MITKPTHSIYTLKSQTEPTIQSWKMIKQLYDTKTMRLLALPCCMPANTHANTSFITEQSISDKLPRTQHPRSPRAPRSDRRKYLRARGKDPGQKSQVKSRRNQQMNLDILTFNLKLLRQLLLFTFYFCLGSSNINLLS